MLPLACSTASTKLRDLKSATERSCKAEAMSFLPRLASCKVSKLSAHCNILQIYTHRAESTKQQSIIFGMWKRVPYLFWARELAGRHNT